MEAVPKVLTPVPIHTEDYGGALSICSMALTWKVSQTPDIIGKKVRLTGCVRRLRVVAARREKEEQYGELLVEAEDY